MSSPRLEERHDKNAQLNFIDTDWEYLYLPGFESVRNRLDWDFLGKYMFCMLLQGSIFFIATLLIEYRVWTIVLAMRKKYYVDGDLDDDGNELDEDVVAERNRVYSDSNSDVLQVKNLFKKYDYFI